MKTELLAPAGDIEAGYAALYYGADAVYVGLQQFSARATAENFSATAIGEFTAYAHSLGRKVYVALNTLIQEGELDELLKNLDICSNCGVDAVIVQDLGVARIVRESYPELDLHASTQMAIHNREGALALQNLGFSRVVAARELTLAEIKDIAAIPRLETEVFIHGALCYSYSGLCQFSAMESGMSANRGKCLYPCRAEFEGESGKHHYFSMKDMALQEDILKLPVTSLKIEGRKKTALYVAAVTNYYRQILDGKGALQKNADDIKQIFSRPWCKLYLNGRSKDVIDRDYVGHRGLFIGKVIRCEGKKIFLKPSHDLGKHDGIQIEVPGQEKPFGFSLQQMWSNGKKKFTALAGELTEILLPPHSPAMEKGYKVFLASSSEVKGAYDYSKPKAGEHRPRHGVKVTLRISSDEVRAEVGDVILSRVGHFEPAQNVEKNRAAFLTVFQKTGNTALELVGLTIINPDERFVPVSLLNDLRRELYSHIPIEVKKGTLPMLPKKTTCSAGGRWLIKTDNPACLENINLDEAEEIIIMLQPSMDTDAFNKFPKNKLRLALPALCRQPGKFKPLIEKLLGQGYKKWEIGNYWGLSVLPMQGIDLSFDNTLYTLNTQAIAHAAKCGASRVTLSVEDNLENWKNLVAEAVLPLVWVVYQDVPLFSSAGCIRSNSCKECLREEKWYSLHRGRERYCVLSKDCQTVMINEKPLSLGTELGVVKTAYFRVDFTTRPYSAAEAAVIWETLRSGKDPANAQKANLYRKL